MVPSDCLEDCEFHGEGGMEGGAAGWGSLPLCGGVRAPAPDSGFFSGSCPTFLLKSYQAW